MNAEDTRALKKARAAILDGASIRKAATASGFDPSIISTLIRFDVLPKTKLEQCNKRPEELTSEIKRLILMGYTNQQVADAIGKPVKAVEYFITTNPEFKGIRKTGRPKA